MNVNRRVPEQRIFSWSRIVYVYGVATVKATKTELGVYIIRHVAVAHSCHRDHCPPERVWDGLEEGILGARLGEVDGTREQHDTCKEEEG